MKQLLEEHVKGTLSFGAPEKKADDAAPCWDDMPKELFEEVDDDDFSSDAESSGKKKNKQRRRRRKLPDDADDDGMMMVMVNRGQYDG